MQTPRPAQVMLYDKTSSPPHWECKTSLPRLWNRNVFLVRSKSRLSDRTRNSDQTSTYAWCDDRDLRQSTGDQQPTVVSGSSQCCWRPQQVRRTVSAAPDAADADVPRLQRQTSTTTTSTEHLPIWTFWTRRAEWSCGSSGKKLRTLFSSAPRCA